MYKYVDKIKVNGEIINLPNCCRWSVRDGRLYNENTSQYEGVEGDAVSYGGPRILGVRSSYRGTVEGVTCYQVIRTKEWGTAVLSTNELVTKNIKHINKVEPVE